MFRGPPPAHVFVSARGWCGWNFSPAAALLFRFVPLSKVTCHDPNQDFVLGAVDGQFASCRSGACQHVPDGSGPVSHRHARGRILRMRQPWNVGGRDGHPGPSGASCTAYHRISLCEGSAGSGLQLTRWSGSARWPAFVDRPGSDHSGHAVWQHESRGCAGLGAGYSSIYLIAAVQSGKHIEDFARSRFLKRSGGGGWIRTNVGVRQRIYSPPPLASRAPLRPGSGD